MQDNKKLTEALQRLAVNPDFKIYTEHLNYLQQVAVNQFTNAPSADLQLHQGRVQSLNHIIGVPKNVSIKN